MKRLALVSGLGRKVSYNQMLVKRYEDMGYQVTEFKFNPIYLMSHHLRNKLDKTAIEIINTLIKQKKTKSLVFLTCELRTNDIIAATASGIWKIIKK